MKKALVAALIAVACAAIAIPTIAFAAVGASPLYSNVALKCAVDASETAGIGKAVGDSVYTGWHHNYVDENGDGICDNYIDGICNGTCEGYGHPGFGHNYVDADGDGVCDNYQNGVCQNYGHNGNGGAGNVAGNASNAGQQNGNASNAGRGGNGSAAGSGNSYGYVDADGDGVCDNYGTGTGGGMHHGQGFGHHGARNR